MVLALAAGASTVMIGGLFSKTLESPSELIEKDGKQFKKLKHSDKFSCQLTI